MLETRTLGEKTGLRVPRLCLGTMNFGEPGRGHQGDWTLGINDARPIFEAAIEAGLFYFDTADIYGVGACEEVVGQLLRDLLPRDEYVINTKIAIEPWGQIQILNTRSSYIIIIILKIKSIHTSASHIIVPR